MLVTVCEYEQNPSRGVGGELGTQISGQFCGGHKNVKATHHQENFMIFLLNKNARDTAKDGTTLILFG